MPSKIKNILKNNFGFSFIEMFFTISILAIAIYGISSFIHQASSQSINNTNKQTLQSDAVLALEEFNSLGTNDNILMDFSYDRAFSTRSNYPTEIKMFLNTPWLSSQSEGIVAELISATTPPAINNAQLIYNSVNAAQSLYNSDIAYCNGQFNGQNLGKLIRTNNNTQVFIQIQAYDLTNLKNVFNCELRPIFTRPRRYVLSSNTNPQVPDQTAAEIANEGFSLSGHSEVGFRIKATAIKTISNNTQKQESEIWLSHSHDRYPPQPVSLALNVKGVNYPRSDAGDMYFISVNNRHSSFTEQGSGYNNVFLAFKATNPERGSVFICQDGDTPNQPWFACDQARLGGIQNDISLTQWVANEHALIMYFKNLTNGIHTLNVKAVDTAGNSSAVTSLKIEINPPPKETRYYLLNGLIPTNFLLVENPTPIVWRISTFNGETGGVFYKKLEYSTARNYTGATGELSTAHGTVQLDLWDPPANINTSYGNIRMQVFSNGETLQRKLRQNHHCNTLFCPNYQELTAFQCMNTNDTAGTINVKIWANGSYCTVTDTVPAKARFFNADLSVLKLYASPPCSIPDPSHIGNYGTRNPNPPFDIEFSNPSGGLTCITLWWPNVTLPGNYSDLKSWPGW